MFIINTLISFLEGLLNIYLNFSGPLLALTLLSLSVFAIMLPLYQFGDMLSARERQRKALMQPELDSVAALPSGNRKYFYTREIYRRHGYNPLYSLVGLFGLAVQVPVFIAAYQMLHHFEAFSGLPAGPGNILGDLSQPDGLLQFAGISVNLLPLIMTLINLFAAAYHAQTQEERSRIWLLPVLFLVLLYRQPAALVFYWSMNNVFSLLKNLWQTWRAGRSLRIPQLRAQNLLRYWRSPGSRALHLGLLFFALFLGTRYFIESDKDKALPILSINIALFLLFYLGVFYFLLQRFLAVSTRPASSAKRLVHNGLQACQLLALLGCAAAIIYLLYLGQQAKLASLMVGKADNDALLQSVALSRRAQELRPLACLLAFGAIVVALALAGKEAWLWPSSLGPYRADCRPWSWSFRFRNSSFRNSGAEARLNSSSFRLYILALACIFVGIFWTAPARAIASDPATFEGNSNFVSLTFSLLLFCLLSAVLFALIYLILPLALRYYISGLAAAGAWFFSVNVLLLPGNYGPMEFTTFRNQLHISANSVGASALLLAALLLLIFAAYLLRHSKGFAFENTNKWPPLDRLLLVILGFHLIVIGSNLYKVAKFRSELAVDSSGPQRGRHSQDDRWGRDESPVESLGEVPKIQLSREGRNVIVLMLDKVMGGYVPEILRDDPTLAERLDGFIYYPNVVSQAQRTYGGFHPIVGGSEYTVTAMNANDRPLAVDLIEAFTMVPKAFKERFGDQDFASYFLNVDYVIVPRARGAMEKRLREEGVQVVHSRNDYDLLPRPELARGGEAVLEWQNFLSLLGLFQAFGPMFRQKIYNHGKWMGLLGDSSLWATVAFWKTYIELLSLSEIFEPGAGPQGSYVLYHNQFPHNTGFVDAQNYFGNPDNFRFPLPTVPPKFREIDEQNGNKDLSTIYLADYETLQLVADCLDKLKELDLYDNSEIYLVSDHGSSHYDPSFAVQGLPGSRGKNNWHRGKGSWHSLYMRKKIGARGPLQTSNEFRTTADLPSEFLPDFGITHNPYSGKKLKPVRSQPVSLYVVEGVVRGEELAGNDRQFYIHSQYELYNFNIFDDANWKGVKADDGR